MNGRLEILVQIFTPVPVRFTKKVAGMDGAGALPVSPRRLRRLHHVLQEEEMSFSVSIMFLSLLSTGTCYPYH